MSTATTRAAPSVSEPQTIFQIFAAAKKEVRAVGKDQRNQQQNFNFRGVDAVVNAAAPALDKHGVITVPVLEEVEYTTVEVGQKRTPMAHVRVKVTYRFHGPAGDHFDAVVPGEAMDSGDKGTAKAMSVAYRIALIQALNLPTSDEDPDAKNYERSPRDSFENAARPARGPMAGARPPGLLCKPHPDPDAGTDEEAQTFADDAHACRSVIELKTRIHATAQQRDKLTAYIADPDTGMKGQLGPYLNFRRKALEAIDAAWADLHKTAEALHMDVAAIEDHVRQVTGKKPETATAADVHKAAAALNGEAALWDSSTRSSSAHVITMPRARAVFR